MKSFVLSTVLLVVGLLSADSFAGDWPQFRFDANRSANSPENLPRKLSLHWVRELPPPRPAFPNENRLDFDASYEPVVLGETMFVPSMVTDSVTALNTVDGRVQWRFFTDGPVRFAPVAWQDKVYFVSDDGHLYCVDASKGRLLWKFRGLPAGRKDRKVLGNGRLISLRPARGGPVLKDGVVYFGAGIWLGDGIFIHALDAVSGKVVWSNTKSHLIEQANLDHGVKSYSGLSPQGYLAVIGEKLAVPCGAQLPAFLDRDTGKLDGYTMGWGGRVGLPKGSWLVAGVGKYLVHSGDLFDMHRPNDEQFKDRRGRPDFKNLLYPGGYTRIQIDPANQRALGKFREPIITLDTMFVGTPDKRIAAFDLTRSELEERSKTDPAAFRKSDQYPDKWKATFPERWSLKSELKVHIKAGSRLYLGGPGVVEAIDVPSPGGKAIVSWHATIQGTPNRMLAADDRLFVVTREGTLYAFGRQRDAKSIVHSATDVRPPARADRWTKAATQILKETKAADGYALVLGVGSGRLAEELVRQSDLFVIAVGSDAGKVRTLREKFHRAGLYGRRIAIYAADPLSYPFPPYLAQLIVSENLEALGDVASPTFIQAVSHSLRPYGGTACFSVSEDRREPLKKAVDDQALPGLAVRQAGNFVCLTRQGALPGAADWSHEGANAANAGASQDRFLKAPLGILWFDGSVRWNRKPGSATIRVADGRVYILADKLMAVDVFTGRHLWEARLPGKLSTPRPELVVVEDGVFIPVGSSCIVLDPATGKKSGQIDLPAELAQQGKARWSRLRVRNDLLVGTVGKNLVCVNRRTGKLLWQFQCQHENLSLAVGEKQVFCAEIHKPSRKPKPNEATVKPRTLAFDLETGRKLWEIPEASKLRYSQTHDLLITTKNVYRGKTGTVVRKSSSLFFVAGDVMITTTPDTLTTFNLLTGEKSSDPLKWYRRGCTDLRACSNLATTRYRGNAAYIDLGSGKITRLWNVRSACNNNLIPANGVLNVPNFSGGCECNYTPSSLAFVPVSVIERNADGK